MRAKLAQNPREQEKFKNKYIYAVYLKYLYEENTSHANLIDINTSYRLAYEELNKETDSFFDLYEAELQKQNEKKELNNEERKQKILSQLKMKLDNTN
jgi:hypothetical protein